MAGLTKRTLKYIAKKAITTKSGKKITRYYYSKGSSSVGKETVKAVTKKIIPKAKGAVRTNVYGNTLPKPRATKAETVSKGFREDAKIWGKNSTATMKSFGTKQKVGIPWGRTP